MADRGSASGKLPTSTMSTRKRMKQGSDTNRGSPELVLQIKLSIGWGFPSVVLCYFYSQGDLLGTRRSDTFSKIHISVTVYLLHFFTRKLILRLLYRIL